MKRLAKYLVFLIPYHFRHCWKTKFFFWFKAKVRWIEPIYVPIIIPRHSTRIDALNYSPGMENPTLSYYYGTEQENLTRLSFFLFSVKFSWSRDNYHPDPLWNRHFWNVRLELILLPVSTRQRYSVVDVNNLVTTSKQRRHFYDSHVNFLRNKNTHNRGFNLKFWFRFGCDDTTISKNFEEFEITAILRLILKNSYQDEDFLSIPYT